MQCCCGTCCCVQCCCGAEAVRVVVLMLCCSSAVESKIQKPDCPVVVQLTVLIRRCETCRCCQGADDVFSACSVISTCKYRANVAKNLEGGYC